MPLLGLIAGIVDAAIGAASAAGNRAKAKLREAHPPSGLARLSSRGRVIVAEEGTHAIHVEQPDLVVKAIREVWDAARMARSDSDPETA